MSIISTDHNAAKPVLPWRVPPVSRLPPIFAIATGLPVIIIAWLLASGMGKGPALALLLAGPSLSLPNMLVIRGVTGAKKTLVYVVLVMIMPTFTGLVYGSFF